MPSKLRVRIEHLTLVRRGIFALIILLVAGVQSSCGRNEGERPPELQPAARQLSHLLRENFAIMQTTPEPLPSSVKTTLRRPVNGSNWRLAQLLDTDTRARVWAVPADETICLVDEQDGGAIGVACTSDAWASEHGVFTAALKAGSYSSSESRRFVVGLAPDAAPRVRVHTPGIEPTLVSVAANTFTLRDAAPRPPESIELLPRRISRER